jgi:ElaB/YqjD/DUF883 family membrane-anchored ribosome-binding protein
MMKNKIYLVALVSMVALGLGVQAVSATEETEKALEQSFEGLRTDLEGLSESATSLLKQKESEFREKLDLSSKELNIKVEEIEKKLAELSDDSGEKLEKYAEILKEKNAELTQKANTAIAKAKEEFSKTLDETLSGVESDLDTWKDKARDMSEENREKLALHLKELREKNKDFMIKMDELKTKSLDSWKDIKAFIFEIWEDLRKTYDEELRTADFEKA